MCSLRQTARPNTFSSVSAASASTFATDSHKQNALPMEVKTVVALRLLLMGTKVLYVVLLQPCFFTGFCCQAQHLPLTVRCCEGKIEPLSRHMCLNACHSSGLAACGTDGDSLHTSDNTAVTFQTGFTLAWCLPLVLHL